METPLFNKRKTKVRQKGNITPSDFKVYAADDTPISTYGVRTLILDLGLRRPYIWKFTVAKIQQPIIGADFLKYHGLLVDLKNRRIIDDYTKIQQIEQLSTVKHSTITTLNKKHNNEKYIKLLKQYIDITRSTQGLETHKIHHHIITSGRPCAERPRRLASNKFKLLLIQQGICKLSSSEWASPLLVHSS
ncbi:uncharacterized protein LOC122536457 [Frieseomelitta varia]|uniref:uncharacterized protein LOC122536457 n=1 Tax=Frieseomelitta varia TaxID=561572 RepID=UPI001CB6AE35|nr:uncharacterized protein LOC122536457 [Frieseomelitta varia]